jgi:hypothetical protein
MNYPDGVTTADVDRAAESADDEPLYSRRDYAELEEHMSTMRALAVRLAKALHAKCVVGGYSNESRSALDAAR